MNEQLQRRLRIAATAAVAALLLWTAFVVVSETEMALLELTQRSFQRLLRDDPTVALKLMEVLARRVRRTERTLQD